MDLLSFFFVDKISQRKGGRYKNNYYKMNAEAEQGGDSWTRVLVDSEQETTTEQSIEAEEKQPRTNENTKKKRNRDETMDAAVAAVGRRNAADGLNKVRLAEKKCTDAQERVTAAQTRVTLFAEQVVLASLEAAGWKLLKGENETQRKTELETLAGRLCEAYEVKNVFGVEKIITTATSLSTDVDHQKEPAQAEARLITAKFELNTAKLELNTAKLELNTAKLLLNTEKSRAEGCGDSACSLDGDPKPIKGCRGGTSKTMSTDYDQTSRPREFCGSRDGWAR